MSLDKPIVAAVHGYCIGSGLEIVLLCDIRVAADDTIFAMPEVRLGMIPAAGGNPDAASQRGAVEVPGPTAYRAAFYGTGSAFHEFGDTLVTP